MISRILRKAFFSLVFISIASVGWLVYNQDYLVFPQLRFQQINPVPQSTIDTPPKDGELFYLTAPDGARIQIARRPAVQAPSGTTDPSPGKIIALFHGNGGTIHRFYGYMNSLAATGSTVYQMEYRGYGGSSGWPTMELLLADAEMLMRAISEREGVPSSEITPFGISLGTGIAANLAATYRTRALGLVSPYTTLKNAGRDRPIIGIFADFMWNDIDVLAAIAELRDTCVVALHGTADEIISYRQSERLQRGYRGNSEFKLILIPGGDHNSVYWTAENEMRSALKQCLL